MAIIEIEGAFVIDSVKNIIVYGRVSGETPIKLGDRLYEEKNKMNIFEVYDFPSIRRSFGYRENYINIGIRPISDTIDKAIWKTLAENLKGKRLIKNRYY